MDNLTLLTTIRLINKMIKISEVHIHTIYNDEKVVWSFKMNELK